MSMFKYIQNYVYNNPSKKICLQQQLNPKERSDMLSNMGISYPLALSILFRFWAKRMASCLRMRVVLLATDASAEACEYRMLMSNHHVSQEKSIFSSSRRAVRNSWSVNAPEIIRCLRACTASIRSSTVPLTMNLLIETLFV